MPTDPPATLAAWLRTRSDEQLSALLVARPDVARPAPSDVVALASRLAVPVSVDRALDELDAATLQVLDVVLLAPTDGVAVGELPAALPDLPADVLDRRDRAADRPAPCCGATSCCAPPTRSAAPSGIRRASAGGPPSCGSSCRPTWRARSTSSTRTSAPCSSGWPGSGRSGTCPTARPTAPGRRPAGSSSGACWPGSTR